MKNINNKIDLNYMWHKFIKIDGLENWSLYKDYTYKCIRCNVIIVLVYWYGHEMYNQVFDDDSSKALTLNCEECIIKNIID